MSKKPKIVDVTFHYNEGVKDYTSLYYDRIAVYGHFPLLVSHFDFCSVHFIDHDYQKKIENVPFHFFKGRKSKLWIPLKALRFIRSKKADIVFVHGFSMPLQILLLSLFSKANLVQIYHGGYIPSGIKGFLQKLITLRVKNFVFTSKKQSEVFLKKGLISSDSRITEIPEASARVRSINRLEARRQVKIAREKTIFLWVGRLEENKDPLTVLNGLRDYLSANEDALLLMIYQNDKLLPQIKSFLFSWSNSGINVELVGKIPNLNLNVYYSSADYFILGSHYEGSGIACIESLGYGCIPLITDIPSFRKLTNEGTLGELWQVRNTASLKEALEKVLKKDKLKESEKIKAHFEQELSFEAIANKYMKLINQIHE